MTSIRRYLPLALLVAIAIAFFATGADRWLSFESLKAHDVALRAYVGAHHWLSLAAFVLVFALVTGASLPGALILTLTGGLLFGAWVGSIATVIGETAGAVLVYLALNASLGAPLRRKAEASGGRLKAIMDGIRSGAFGYILTLRLIPVAPFWLINVAAALADAPLKAYALATFIGIIPATVIYSSVGAGIGKIIARGETPKLDVIFEPFVLGPLLALGLLSLGATLYHRSHSTPASRRRS